MINTVFFLIGVSVVNFATRAMVQNFYVLTVLGPLYWILRSKLPKPASWSLLALGLGVFWGLMHAYLSPWHQSSYLSRRTEHHLVGIVASEPVERERSKAFIFETVLGRVNLNWYGYSPKLIPGDRWELSFRLIPVKQYYNEVGFNYSKWLMLKGVVGKGYVLTKRPHQLCGRSSRFLVLRLRHALQERLQHSGLSHWEIISGLVLGLRNHMTDEVWQLLRKTNTSHLLAISGLHIGMIGGWAFWVFRTIWRQFFTLTSLAPANVAASYVGLVVSFFYAMMAGFSTPTQRAFIMLGIGFVNTIFRKPFFTWQSFSLALLFILITQPLSVMSIGFWLSFLAAFCLIVTLSNRKYLRFLWLRTQLGITVFLFPWLLIFFKEVALVGWVANFIAIPFMSFVILPLAFLGTIIYACFSDIFGKWVLGFASLGIDFLLKFLGYFAHLPTMHWVNVLNTQLNMFLACLGALILLLPKGIPGRLLGICLFLPLLTHKPLTPKSGECWASILDVGHGLAVYLQTEKHALLYDLGTPFMTRSVLAPFLQQKGVNAIDKVIISHPDFDHLGAINFIAFQYPNAVLESSDRLNSQKENDLCRAGDAWDWDGVHFEYLYPFREFLRDKTNDRSCVLKVSSQSGAFLLTGDIGKAVERDLISRYREHLRSRVLLVPHHGSSYASSSVFLEAVQPQRAVVSTIYPPAKLTKILKRYNRLAIPIQSTYQNGQIDVHFLKDRLVLKSYRQIGYGLWYDSELRQS